MIPLSWSLTVSSAILAIAIMGLLVHRNALRVLVCVELILNAANLNLVAFANHWGKNDGLLYTLFIIALAAAEAAVGLAILIHYYRHVRTVDVDRSTLLRW